VHGISSTSVIKLYSYFSPETDKASSYFIDENFINPLDIPITRMMPERNM